MTTRKTTYEAVFDVLNTFPEGLANFEIIACVDDEVKSSNISALLSLMVKEGLAKREGARLNPATGQMNTVYRTTGIPFWRREKEFRTRTRKRKRPADTELIELREWKRCADAELIELREWKRRADAELIDAREWKRRAIERFPDLAAPDFLLQARQRVAAILREEGLAQKAALVETGELDEAAMMLVARSLLSGQA